MNAVRWVQNSRKVGVGSVAGVAESVVIARRMMVLAFVVKRVQLGSFSSFALVSSLCLSWNVSAIFAMARVSSGGAVTVIPWVGVGFGFAVPGRAADWIWSWCRFECHCCSIGPGDGWIGEVGMSKSWLTAHNHWRSLLNSS